MFAYSIDYHYICITKQTDKGMEKTMNEEKHLMMTTRGEYDYTEYVGDCEENGEDPAPENSTAFYEWCAEQDNINLECDRDNLECSPMNKGKFFVSGVLGLWNGRPEVHAEEIFDSLLSAIDRCISDSIIDYEVEFNNGVVEVSAHHHDGTNCFTIQALTEEGVTGVEELPYTDYNPQPSWFQPIKYAL